MSKISERDRELEVPVPCYIVGFFIGKNGETIKRIQADTGARVQFDINIMVSGPSPCVVASPWIGLSSYFTQLALK